MTLTYDLFLSFRSPYSYLVTPRLLEFEREYDVKANVRPVYPIAVRINGFFKNVNPLWRSYLVRDVARTAQMLGMPYSSPNPDPIVMSWQTGEVSKTQPHIGRLTRLGVAAAERGKGRYEAVIVESETAQERAGHWGVPLMAFENEPFFGQDRFGALKWRMAQTGLLKRRA